MTNALKKIYIAITGMLMAMTVQVNGVVYDSTPCCEVSCCEPCRMILKGELLYWTPQLCGLEGAFGSTAIATTLENGIVVTTLSEFDEEPHSKWSPGFRIGGEIACDNYDIEADWTHFNGRATFNKETNHGHWKIQYDAVDLTFGRNVNLWSCFNFKPYIGVRALRIHQKLNSHLETIFTSSIGNSTVLTDKHDREDFHGVGPELGLEIDFNLGCNLSLYGSFDVVTYYGRVKGTNCDTDLFRTTASVTHSKTKRCFNNIATDAEIGIRWDKSMCCSCYEIDFMLKLGLEQHRIYDFSHLGSDGTLSLDGGVLGVGVGFRY